MLDQFTHLVADASGWAYFVLFVVAAIDAILPIVPSETAVITAGVVAAASALSLALIIFLAAAGALARDNLSYGIGRQNGTRASDRFFSGAKAQRRLAAAARHLDQRGAELIAVARFIPGGRTAVTLTAGFTHFAWRRFLRYDALSALVWSCYAALLGYFGGTAFENPA